MRRETQARPRPPFPSRIPRLPQGGFTLLEVLVVVLIIGIVASFAVLSIGGRAIEDRMDNEARRLGQLVGLAQEQAQQHGRELGFLHTPDGYVFLTLDAAKGVWVPVGDGPLRARGLAAPLYLDLRVEGQPVPPTDPAREDAPPLVPQVLILSSGECSAFDLQVHARGFAGYYRVQGDVMGRVKVERAESPS